MSSSKDVDKRDADGLTKLHHAAKKGDLAEVKRLVSAGADVNCGTAGRFEFGKPALHIASQYGHLEVVRFLLDSGADIEAESHDMYELFFCIWFETNTYS